MDEVWSDEKEAALVETLKQLPDFDRYPLPGFFYKKYNLPPTKPLNFKEFAESGYWMKCHFDPRVEKELRTEPVPGGVRPVLDIEPVMAETITKEIVPKCGACAELLEGEPEKKDQELCLGCEYEADDKKARNALAEELKLQTASESQPESPDMKEDSTESSETELQQS